MAATISTGRRIWNLLASVKTGIILLIILGVVSAAGTLILQRPTTDAEQIQRAYSPTTLLWLDRLGMTDVFHSWWFALLMTLLATSIVCVSIDRFPKAWRMLTHPYKFADSHFRVGLPVQRKIAVEDSEAALDSAEKVMRKIGLRPERVTSDQQTGLFAEKNRLSVLSVYVVHTSLLLILLGGIIDAFVGYRGFLQLTPGQTTDKLELRAGQARMLGFTIRCDGTGQENYADGSPKKWWSRLTVIEDGKETKKKEIVVNDPLVTHGLRFYQASYGSTGKPESLLLSATPVEGGEGKQITLRPGQSTQIDAETSVQLAEFIPDFVIRDNQIYARSNNPVNPAIQLTVTGKAGASQTWLFPEAQGQVPPSTTGGYTFKFDDMQIGAYTGLEVSYEPGQWAVWTGCVLMGLGLVMAFYAVHQRFWAVVVQNRGGEYALWLGMAAEKNREHFQEHFEHMCDEIKKELSSEQPAASEVERETPVSA